MTQRTQVFKNILSGVMLLLTGIGTAAVLAIRIWLTPSVRDWETGLFSPNYLAIGVMLLCLAALLVMGRLCGPDRREIAGRPAMALGIVLLMAGATLAIYEAVNLWGALSDLFSAVDALAAIPGSVSLFSPILQVVQSLVGVASGGTLILLCMRLFSEGATRRGIAQWSALLPVVWMWLRLLTYEMSYASMIRLEDSFFGFVMLLLEMWFLFKLARYVAGVGRVSMGSLLGCSLSTALFALTAPAVRLCMYLLQDFSSYEASLATAEDFAIGCLAAAVALTLALSLDPVQESAPSEVDAEAAAEFASSEAYIVADLLTASSDEEGESDSDEDSSAE